MKELAGDMKGRAIIGLVRESERELFKAFGVKGIPAIFVMRNAEVRHSFLGTQNKDFLAKVLKDAGTSTPPVGT